MYGNNWQNNTRLHVVLLIFYILADILVAYYRYCKGCRPASCKRLVPVQMLRRACLLSTGTGSALQHVHKTGVQNTSLPEHLHHLTRFAAQLVYTMVAV